MLTTSQTVTLLFIILATIVLCLVLFWALDRADERRDFYRDKCKKLEEELKNKPRLALDGGIPVVALNSLVKVSNKSVINSDDPELFHDSQENLVSELLESLREYVEIKRYPDLLGKPFVNVVAEFWVLEPKGTK